MALPKYVTIRRNGVEYIDGTDRAQYCISELTRAAMRDVGKFVTMRAKTAYYRVFRRLSGKSRQAIQYWVPKTDYGKVVQNAVLYVGFKTKIRGFYAAFSEKGTKFLQARGILTDTVSDNLDEIRKIEAQYLSAIELPDDGESLIDESEEISNDD